MPLVQPAGLRLCHIPMTCCDKRGPQLFAAENRRVVEIDEPRIIGKLELRQREGESPAPEQRRRQALTPETRELLDDARDRLSRQIKTAIDVRIVVTAFALE